MCQGGHRLGRPSHDESSLVDREPHDVTQPHRITLVDCQGGQHRGEVARQLFFGSIDAGTDFVGERGFVRSTRLSAACIDDSITGDSKGPWAKFLCRTFESRKRANYLHHRFAKDIVGARSTDAGNVGPDVARKRVIE